MPDQTAIDGDQIIASAFQYLVEGEEFDAAETLLFCNVENIEVIEEDNFRGTSYGVEVRLRGPRLSCDRIQDDRGQIRKQVEDAIVNGLPFGHWISSLVARAAVFVPDPNWRDDLQELIKGRGVTNQASGAENPRMWQGFRFRSATEIKIAEALDRAGVLFFPLPKARVAVDDRHMNVEPDFVVCQEGRWGILEVTGNPSIRQNGPLMNSIVTADSFSMASG